MFTGISEFIERYERMNLYGGAHYWAWCAFITLATIWGGIFAKFELDFIWGVVGAIVLISLAQLLRRWDRSRVQATRGARQEES